MIPERINWSTLKEISVSPLNFQWRLQNPRADTDALRLGRAVHCLALEGEDALANGFVTAAQCAARTKSGNECRSQGTLYLAGRWYCRVQGHAPDAAGDPPEGVEIVTDYMLHVAGACTESLRAHPVASDLLSGGSREQDLQWRDPETGMACRGRVDLLNHDGRYVVDLKTTRHGTPDSIERDAQRLLYWGQIAWYRDGAITAGRLQEDAAAYLIAVQTSGPYDVAVWRLDREALEAGRDLYSKLLATYKHCQAADWWPGMALDILNFEVPWWQQVANDRPNLATSEEWF